jgi:small subunit ribosomal protein S16
MVVLRLKRMGRSHRAFFRLNAMDQRSPRDGRVIEELGWYDPIAAEDKQLNLKTDRIDYWLSVGAQPSETVRSLLRRIGVDPKSGKKLVPGAGTTSAATQGAGAASTA